MFFHEIFYYTVRLFVVASHLLLINPRFTEAVKAKSELVAPSFPEKEGLLFYENRYVLPNDKAIKLGVLSANHDSKVGEQFGQFKTQERFRQNFFWSKIDRESKDYVRSCDVCQRDKTSRRK